MRERGCVQVRRYRFCIYRTFGEKFLLGDRGQGEERRVSGRREQLFTCEGEGETCELELGATREKWGQEKERDPGRDTEDLRGD